MEDVPTKAMRGRLKERSGGHEGHGKGHSSHGTFDNKMNNNNIIIFSKTKKNSKNSKLTFF